MKTIKKIIISTCFILGLNFNCYAEGQEGVAEIFNTVHTLWALMCISIYGIIGGIIIKLILLKLKILVKNQTRIAFSFSFLLAIIAYFIIGDNYLNFIWSCL